jgi:hypothetical protein
MVAALVRWSFGTLARQFPVCLLQQALLRMINFARLQQWMGEDGGAPSARASVCSRR